MGGSCSSIAEKSRLSEAVPLIERKEGKERERKDRKEDEVVPAFVTRPIWRSFSSILGFKICDYVVNAGFRDPTIPTTGMQNSGKSFLYHVYALVWMEIPLGDGIIRESDTGRIVSTADSIDRNTKYCCPMAEVIGVQFLGQPSQVNAALIVYHQETGFVVSRFEPSFVYEPEKIVEEKNFGVAGKGGCIQGIHFFPNWKRATHYGGAADCYERYPLITKRLSRQRVFQVVPDTNLLTKEQGSEEEKKEKQIQEYQSLWEKSKLTPLNWKEKLMN